MNPPGGLRVTPCDFLSCAIFRRGNRRYSDWYSINTLIEKPKTLRWRPVTAMLLAFTERFDRRPGNVGAPELTATGAARRADIPVKLEG